MARARRKVSARRSSSNRSGSKRRVTRSKSAPKRSYAPKRARKSSASRKRAPAQRSVRIVLETAGAAPVRAGESVGIGQKVAPTPRLKPRF